MKQKRHTRNNGTIRWGVSIVGLLLIIIVFSYIRFPSVWEYTQEDVMMRVNPSALRAFEYGERHFSAINSKDYDIDRAESFFKQAATLDPSFPLLYHELARIYFIQGDLHAALSQIDLEIASEGDNSPHSYYVRGLIEGYMGNYVDAENDYAHYNELVPNDWAGMNDYVWVLLKDNKPKLAADVSGVALLSYPYNPWLLNSNATALYEIGDIKEAKIAIDKAQVAVSTLTPEVWSVAYPGNSPDIASEGVTTFKAAVAANQQKIDVAQK